MVAKRFVMFEGLPGCGKSTEAEKMVLAAPAGHAVRINRDLLRTMLHADRWKGDRTEKPTLAARDALIETMMRRGVPLIISDDTNFHKETCEDVFRDLAFAFNYTFEIEDMSSVPPEVCIERDLKRPRSVGSKVIMGMYDRYVAPAVEAQVIPGLPWAVLVDIDGTLAHMQAPVGGKVRSPYDWQRVDEDVVDEVVVQLMRDAWNRGDRVILLSGRDGECETLTVKWLADNGVDCYHSIHMRAPGDMRKDSIVKAELFDEHVADKYNVRYVLDDRDQVVRMWRQRGLKVLQVEPGDF